MHPVLRERRALLAYLAAWLLASYLPASLLAAPGGPRFLVALAIVAPATVLLGLGALPIHYVCRVLPLGAPGGAVALRVHAALALVAGAAWWGLLRIGAALVDGVAPAAPGSEVERRWVALLGWGWCSTSRSPPSSPPPRASGAPAPPSGFEVLELLDPGVGVVFTTAYDQHALRAFEVNAVDYLLKPFTDARFAQALERAEQRLGAPRPISATALASAARPSGCFAARLVIKDGARVELLPVAELDYARAQGDYVELVSGPRSWLKEQTVHELEGALDPARFVRVHRSYLIQGARLARIEPVSKDARVAVLTTGARIPISDSGLRRLQAWLARAGGG